MSSPQDWDERFRTDDHATPTPDPFLSVAAGYWDLIPRPNDAAGNLKALDLACGAGRHAVSLAESGFDVTAIDFSPEGLRKGAALARQHGAGVNWVEQDLEREALDLGDAAYDLVVVFFFLHRPLFAAIERCLKTGGLLLYKTYSVDQLRYPGRPRHRMYLLEHNELLRAFGGFRVLVYEEEWQGKGTASLLAQKP